MNLFFEIPMFIASWIGFWKWGFKRGHPSVVPRSGMARNGMPHLSGGRGCAHNRWLLLHSLLSVGLIPTGGGVVYINNYRLAVVHRFERTKKFTNKKKREEEGGGGGGQKKRNYGASAPGSVHLLAPRAAAVSYLRRDGTHFPTSPCDRGSGGEVRRT